MAQIRNIVNNEKIDPIMQNKIFPTENIKILHLNSIKKARNKNEQQEQIVDIESAQHW